MPAASLSELPPKTRRVFTDRLLVALLASIDLSQFGRAEFAMICQTDNGIATEIVLDPKVRLLWDVGNAIDECVELVEETSPTSFSGDTERLPAEFFNQAAEERQRFESLRNLISSLDLLQSLTLLMRIQQFWAARDPDLNRRLDIVYTEMMKAT